MVGQGNLPGPYRAYLESLAATIRQPEPARLKALQDRASHLVETWPATLSPDTPPPLRTPAPLLLRLARLFDRYNEPGAAVQCQAEAIEYLRRQAESPDDWHTLSVALYNQSGYLAQLERFDQAVAALEEVVAIDERFGLPDLESDRAALAQMKRRQEGLPEERMKAEGGRMNEAGPAAAFMAQLEGQLAELPPEAREAAQQLLRQLKQMSPVEQEAMLQAMQQQALEQQAEAIVAAARQAHRQNDTAGLIPQLEQVVANFAQAEAAGSPGHQLAQFSRAVIALLRGQPLPPVPAAYAEKLAALQRDLQS